MTKKLRITYATNIKPVFYFYTVMYDGIFVAKGWTFRWIKFHLQYERKEAICPV